MKKIFLFFALTAMVASAQDEISFENIRGEWMNTGIETTKIGNNPSVIKLIDAFQKQWPTWMGENIVKRASEKHFTSYEDPEQFWQITYDAKSDYVFLNSSENEAGSLHAITYQMQNGHTLLCVVIGVPYDQGDDIVCYYEYDPAKSYMEPWRGGPDAGYEKIYDGSLTSINVPLQKSNLSFQEYFYKENDDKEIFLGVKYNYKWNGKEFLFDSNETSFPMFFVTIQYKEWWDSKHTDTKEPPSFTKFTWVDIDHDGTPELIYSDDEEKYQGVYTIGTGVPLLCVASDERHKITYYDRAVACKGNTEKNPDEIVTEYGLMIKSECIEYLNVSQNLNDKSGKYHSWLSLPDSENKEKITMERCETLLGKIGEEQDLTSKIKWKEISEKTEE